jgi:3-isopropylmalate dehydrogenase
MDEWAYSTDEIKRITRVAAHLALRSNPPKPIISCDKANVLASSRLWRRVVTQTLESDFPTLKFSHQLADSAAMIMMVNPKSMNGVILADNTFGDILSDVAAAIPGSLGVLPSASINGTPNPGGVLHGLYEPTHGSAPR